MDAPRVRPIPDAQTRRRLLLACLAQFTSLPIVLTAGNANADADGVSTLFPSFERFRIEVAGINISGVKAGKGPPVLLLHGWPQSFLEWRFVGPMLARDFTVVATDLRGYGSSDKPPDGDNHSGYSKRAMALDQVGVMREMGFPRFHVVGHDRGGRVGHRMALDHPDVVLKLAVLDIVPTLYLYTHVTKEFATAYYHWFFLLQPAPLPEKLNTSNAEFLLRERLFRDLLPTRMSEQVLMAYVRSFADMPTQHAMCEDYRAAASIDLEHDRADLDRKVACPLLAAWGAKGVMARLNVTETWKERADHVTGTAIDGGHWLPEQLPDDVYRVLTSFLRS